MRKNTNKAFTLVELIVVITILAVLGTIAFISLQGYSADARNSKRTSDVNNIQSAMGIKQAEGSSLMAFIGTQANRLDTIALAGEVATATTGTEAEYNVGNPNYIALGVKEDEFKDPNGQDYKIAAITSSNGKMEIAASIEDGAERVALVKGTYAPRSVADSTGTISAISGNIVTLSATDTNKFYKGDTVTDGATTTTVTKVARDGTTVTLDDILTFDITNNPSIELNDGESLGLIAGVDSTATAITTVENEGSVLPY